MNFKLLAILVGFIMVFSPLSISGTASTPIPQQVVTLSLPSQSAVSTVTPTVAKPTTPYFSGQVVIFANSKADYNQLILEPGLITAYPHLQAVKLNPTKAEFTKLANQYDQLLPAYIFTQDVAVPTVPSSGMNINGPGTDGTVDGQLVGVQHMWDLGYNGSGITVAVIDNGVNFAHPALADAYAGQVSVTTGPASCRTHGTAVAGSIAARNVPNFSQTVGTAPGSKIYALEAGCGDQNSLALDSLKAWDNIFANNATIDIVNTSYGGPPNIVYNNFVQQAEQLGIIVVGAAGNDNTPGSSRNLSGGPGNTVWGLSVAASKGSNIAATFSSVGPGYDFNQKPDITAPGDNVYVLNTADYNAPAIESGTSFASPITAGAVATLIQALKDQGIKYNVGMLKAAIMRSASPISGTPNQVGFGFLNITAAYNLVKTLSLDSNSMPEIVEISPKDGPVGIINTIPQGTNYEATYTLVSSNPGQTTISFDGGLAGIATAEPLSSDQSQFLKIKIDTSSLSENSVLTGTITATNGADTVTANLKLNIGVHFKGKVAMDLRHTSWNIGDSDRLDGSNTGQMVRLAFAKGWIVDEINQEITSTLLSNYDMLWMPDAFSAVTASDLNADLFGQTITMEHFITQSEINAIHSFVAGGGNLFIDFNGVLTDATTNNPSMNATAANDLLSTFTITTSTTQLATPSDPTYVSTLNSSSLIKGISQITHFGNYLEVGQNAIALTQDVNGKVTTAMYTDASSGGRVLATSTNFWLDNFGAIGKYTAAGGSNDARLASNVWNWFGQTQKIAKISETTTSNSISGQFAILDGNSPGSGTPIVKLRGNALVAEEIISPTSLGSGKYSFDYSLSGDGFYQIEVDYGSDYIAYAPVVIDTTGPAFSFNATEGQANGTTVKESSTYIIALTIKDALTTISKVDINATYNGELLTAPEAYNPDTGVYRTLLSSSLIGEVVANKAYNVHLDAIDGHGIKSSATYTFYIGDPTTTSSSDSASSSSTSGTPFNTAMIFLAIFSGGILIRKKKYLK